MEGDKNIKLILENLTRQTTLISGQTQLLEDHGARLQGVETALTALAVQEEKLDTLKTRQDAMWKKHDLTFGLDGTISKVIAFQARCPKKDIVETKQNLEAAIRNQWNAIRLLYVVTAGLVAKVLGIV